MSPQPPESPFRDQFLEIADEIGTPTYVYAESVIRQQIERLQTLVGDLPTRLLYAVKANFNSAILETIIDSGLGIDAVSYGEVELARQHGAAPEDILFSGTFITDEEMTAVYNQDVLLNIGSLSRLQKFGEAFPGSDVCLRLNPDIGAGHHEHVVTGGKDVKFGISVRQLDTIRELLRTHDLTAVGLHHHIGSGVLEVKPFWEAMQVLMDAGRAFPEIEFLNFGGGFGIPEHPGDEPLDVDAFREMIQEPLEAYLDEHPSVQQFRFEPGRFLVAESGTLLTRVNTLKDGHNTVFAGTDTGFNHLIRPALYDAHHPICNLSNPDGPASSYHVAGNICETGDILGPNTSVQTIREGDVLAITNTGAYGMSMASHYNLRALPAEVMIDADGEWEVVRPRDSIPEMLHRATDISP